MSSIIKVLLLLTVLATLSSAQRGQTTSCLCSSLRQRLAPNIQAMNFYEATTFCDTLEIVVTLKDGRRFCLDPKSQMGRHLQQKRSQTTPNSLG